MSTVKLELGTDYTLKKLVKLTSRVRYVYIITKEILQVYFPLSVYTSPCEECVENICQRGNENPEFICQELKESIKCHMLFFLKFLLTQDASSWEDFIYSFNINIPNSPYKYHPLNHRVCVYDYTDDEEIRSFLIEEFIAPKDVEGASHYIFDYKTNTVFDIAGEFCSFKASRSGRKPLTLTYREQEILLLSYHGYDSREIAGKLDVSKLTVQTQKKNLYQKMCVRNITQAVLFALVHNLFSSHNYAKMRKI